MNNYINAQITNIETMLKSFETACDMAALQDDGKVSKEEEKALKRIHKATAQYVEELNKCK